MPPRLSALLVFSAEIPNDAADADFDSADKNGDGVLSYADFAAADHTPDELKPSAIDQLDLNNDGELSIAEFVAALQTEIVQASDSDSDGKIDTDASNDGAVTHAELVQASPLIAEMDANQDGVISVSELIDTVAPTVTKLDQNGNGKVWWWPASFDSCAMLVLC